MKLREVIAANVGDVATPEYFASLGYDEDSLNAEAALVYDSAETSIYDVPGGWHISTYHEESFTDECPDEIMEDV